MLREAADAQKLALDRLTLVCVASISRVARSGNIVFGIVQAISRYTLAALTASLAVLVAHADLFAEFGTSSILPGLLHDADSLMTQDHRWGWQRGVAGISIPSSLAAARTLTAFHMTIREAL